MITIPTIKELQESILADLEAQMGKQIPLLGKNFLRILAGVQAAKLKTFYLAIGKLQKNIFVDTADSEFLGGTLERFGRVKLKRNPFPATAGQYELTVTGSIGAVIKAGVTFKSDDDALSKGMLYQLDTEHTMTGTSDTIVVRALSPGVGSKLLDGDTLTVTSPIALVDSTATVSDEIVEPKAAETLEAYRTATLNSYRLEAKGGAATDYRLWAANAQGVQRVYPYATTDDTFAVDLYVEATIDDSIDGKGTPSAQLLLDVEQVINFDPDNTLPVDENGRRPINVKPNMLPITVRNIDIEIADLANRTPEIEALITAAINAGIAKMRPFVDAADSLASKNDILDVNKLIGMIISAQPGAVFSGVTFTVDSVSVSTYTFNNGNIPYTNSVTYVP
jgi:uncharacterized phage protein gp47/JayE